MSISKDQIINLLGGLVEPGTEIVIGVALIYSAMKTWSNLKFTSSAFQRIGRAKIVCISDLRTLLQSESGYPREELVVVRGIVKKIRKNWTWPRNTLVSKETGMQGAVLQQTWASIRWSDYINELYSKPWNPRLHTSIEKIPFALSGGGYPDHVLVNLEGSAQPLPLTTLVHRSHGMFYKSDLPVAEFFFGSVLREEKMLQFGKVISAVGSCSLQDGYPQIKSCNSLPYFLSDMTKDQMVEDLAHEIRDLFVCCIILGLLSFGFFSYIFKKYWSSSGLDIPNEQSCGMCLQKSQKYVGQPCRHVVCCERCVMLLQQLSDLKCNFCRKTVWTFELESLS